jgi:hypothetical protein
MVSTRGGLTILLINMGPTLISDIQNNSKFLLLQFIGNTLVYEYQEVVSLTFGLLFDLDNIGIYLTAFDICLYTICGFRIMCNN